MFLRRRFFVRDTVGWGAVLVILNLVTWRWPSDQDLHRIAQSREGTKKLKRGIDLVILNLCQDPLILSHGL